MTGIELLIKGYDKTQEEHKDDKQAKEEHKERELTAVELMAKGYAPKEDKENETKEGE